jgi:hypothetical protein
MLELGWVLFAVEVVFSIFFGYVFWRFWSRSTMDRSVAIKATVIYVFGCVVCLLFMFFLPL